MASKFVRSSRENIASILETKSVPEPNTGCLLWCGGSDKDGYGKIKYEGKHSRAHRVAFAIVHGPIPERMLIQHSCDTPACINVNHLSLGTPLSNMQDKVGKGRLKNQHMAKTHCPRGHKYSYFHGGRRGCRVCTQSKRRIKAGLEPWPDY